MFSRNTPGSRKVLREKKAAVAGLGGLGSNIAVMLARAGVGRLLLVDHDTVEISNLNRQHYDITHLGMPKTDALRMQIERIDPFVAIETKNVKVTEDNAERIFGDHDVICEAFDDPRDKAMLADVLLPLGKTVVAASGISGMGSANEIRTERMFSELYVCGDKGADEDDGLMSPRVTVCAGHQANIVLRILLNMERER
ncbi:MAG: sulfur carrier protein ThiS adenylyltransferase ThiF [Methanomassiliicoccaceae archaeon]|nr:sulfur carrier protein ThiS adenylyltransferase ThiF [Methanomassiliicoccaceae archaeon]